MKIDINNKHFYQYDKPELRERTKKRLTEMSECGMTEIGIADFGIKGVMSGLYIEKVWYYSDEEFNSYMNWAKELKINKSLKSKTK